MGTEEELNPRILSSVIDNTCTNLLRQILHHSVPQTEMPKVLYDVNTKKQLFNILKKPQKDILYPQNGYFNGSYSELDLSLLYILIRNVSKIPEHQNGWGETPSPTDQSVAANVERLRFIRNKQVHTCSGNLSKNDFETIWNKLINCIELLEKTLPDNKEQYKEEAEAIRKEILQATKLKETVREIQDDIAAIKNKQAENEKQFQSEAQTAVVLKGHVECKTYFRTTAVDTVIENLGEHNIAILAGKQGDGKTTLAYQVMCELSRESSKTHKRTSGKKPILISNADQWLKYINPEDDVIVYIDDFVGSTNFTKDEAARWKRAIDSMYACTQHGNVLLLLGIQKQILEEAREQFSYHKLLSDDFVVDTSILTPIEKREIFDLFEEQYIQKKVAQESSSVIATKNSQNNKSSEKVKESIINTESSYGFPLSCRLFFDKENFHELGVAFFNRPDKNLFKEIEKLRKEEHFSYIILVYILICDKIDIDEPNEELLKNICTALNYSDRLLEQSITNAVDTLKNPYLVKITEQEYQFSHKTVSDNVLLSFGKVAPGMVVKKCSRRHLFELIRTPETKKCSTELVLRQKHFEALAKRLLSLDDNSGIKGKKVLNIAINIVWHPASTDEKFVESLLRLDEFRNNENLLSKMWYVIPGSISSAILVKMLDLYKQKSKFDEILKACIVQCIDNYAGNLHTLCCLKHIAKDTELHKILNLPFKHSPEKMTLLHCSVLYRWEDVVDEILKIHKPTLAENGWNCLHFAAYIGSSTLLKRFAEYGLDIASVTKDGHSVLQAAFFGMRYGAFETNWPVYSIYEKDRFQMSLCFPSNDEFAKTLQYIFQCSPAIVLDNIKMEVDEYGNTIFYYLVLQDYPDIINLLSRHIEDSVLERNSTELPTLLHLAVYLGRPLITRILWNDAVRPIGNDPSLMDTLYEGQKFQNKSIVFSDLDVTTKWCWNDKKNRCDGVKIKIITNIDVIFGSKKDFDDVKSFLQSQGE